MSELPLISVITINRNNATGLSRTAKSVLQQEYPSLEYVVIDGASTDNSIDVLKGLPPEVKWISEPDKGIYHAMNKGIGMATGEYLLFLNSGDTLIDAQSILRLIQHGDNRDIIYGNIRIHYTTETIEKSYPDILSFQYFLDEALPHPATLLSRTVFTKMGLYNEHNRIVSDWEFMMRAICIHGVSYKHVNQPISNFYADGISSNPAYKELLKQERNAVLQQQYGLFLLDYRRAGLHREELSVYRTSRLHRWVESIRKRFISKT